MCNATRARTITSKEVLCPQHSTLNQQLQLHVNWHQHPKSQGHTSMQSSSIEMRPDTVFFSVNTDGEILPETVLAMALARGQKLKAHWMNALNG